MADGIKHGDHPPEYWRFVRSTDDAMHLGWSEASQEVSTWLDEEGPWIIEGVALPRALRKWLRANEFGKPCDRVILLRESHEKLSKGQQAMAKGLWTVWAEIVPELRHRGVEIVNKRSEDS